MNQHNIKLPECLLVSPLLKTYQWPMCIKGPHLLLTPLLLNRAACGGVGAGEEQGGEVTRASYLPTTVLPPE